MYTVIGVACRLCGSIYEQITWTHLRYEHEISTLDYSRMFPNAPMISEENREGKRRASTGNEYALGSFGRTGQINSEYARKATGEANRALWGFLSEEEKLARLRDSFHGRESREKSTRTIRKKWNSLSDEEKRDIARKSLQSDEAIRRNLEAQGLKNISGSRNPNYGNIKEDRIYRTYGWGWKDIEFFIWIRDKFTCQKCGIRQYTKENPISCHHIDHNTENVEDTNLVTVCKSCNSSINGSDSDYWIEFFEARIREIYGVEGG